MVEVLVEHDYVAKEYDELTIKKGDIIKDVIRKQGGWWEGILNDKKGLFPDNFVKVISPESPVILRNKADVSRIRTCRVVFSYNQDHEDELSLNVGDVINIIGEEEEGWWRGMLNGKEGVFPSNFVEEIKTPTNITSSSSKENLVSKIENEVDTKAPSIPAKLLCIAKYSYTAQNEDELSLNEGDKVTVLNKNLEDPGWWRGELNGKIGVFPDNFVEIVGDDSKPAAVLKPLNMPTSIAAQRKLLEHKNDSSKTPPVPTKKPIISLKKSPSGSLLSDLKKKLVDVVDGASSSKSSKTDVHNEVKEHNNNNEAFDQVERKPLLMDVRANRAKPPGRRPPSTVLKPSDVDFNGVQHIDNVENDENTEESPELRPKIREWEKHKAPWLNEMKQHQAKRTSTSPGPDRKLKVTPAIEKETLDIEPKSPTSDVDNKPLKASPIEKTSPTEVIRPSPPVASSLKPKPSLNEVEKAPAVKQKPAVPLTNKFNLNLQNNSKEIPPKPKISPILSPPVQEKPVVDHENVSYKQYSDLLERVKKLETLLEKQHLIHTQAIEELKGKLDLEMELRRLLKEKVDKMSQYVMQV